MPFPFDRLLNGPTTRLFGEPAVYVRSGVEHAIAGIFMPEVESIDQVGETEFVVLRPALDVRASALPAGAAQGDYVRVHGRQYIVRANSDRGEGMRRLHLGE